MHQFSDKCFCSNTYNVTHGQVDETECHSSCSGYPDTKCGGNDTLSIFQRGKCINIQQ